MRLDYYVPPNAKLDKKGRPVEMIVMHGVKRVAALIKKNGGAGYSEHIGKGGVTCGITPIAVSGSNAVRTAGSAQPIFIAGIRYKSIFEAWIETEISSVWMWKMLKASGGFPVVIKRRLVATEYWVKQRVTNLEAMRI